MTAWEITNAIAAFLLPPGCLLLLIAAALVVMHRRRGAGMALIGISGVALYVLSMPYAAERLVQSLEPPYTDPLGNPAGQAIVILGAGRYMSAPEYGRDTANSPGLVRMRYGAHLYRTLGKPVLVTGGNPRGDGASEGEIMKTVLETEFNVPVRWVEGASNTTYENAIMSRQMLNDTGVNTVYLVTHAWHMPRARRSFEQAGFTVIAAPTQFKTSDGPLSLVDFLPSGGALHASSTYAHEVLGMAWYRLKSLVSQVTPRPEPGES